MTNKPAIATRRISISLPGSFRYNMNNTFGCGVFARTSPEGDLCLCHRGAALRRGLAV